MSRSALQSPVFTHPLIGSPIDFVECLIGSPITLQSTDAAHRFKVALPRPLPKVVLVHVVGHLVDVEGALDGGVRRRLEQRVVHACT